MKALPLALATLLLVPAALHAQPAPPAAQKDPVVTVWRMEDGRQVRFRDNRNLTLWTPGRNGMIEGKWDADPFAEGIRRYQVNWHNGRVWTIEMAKDASMLRVSNPEGEKFTCQRLEEHTAYLQCNDAGGLEINGVRMIHTPKKGNPEPLQIRSGDIITLSIAKRKGDAAFALEIFRGNDSVISAKDFVFHTAPPPDWQKTKDLTGFRPVDTVKMRELTLGNVTAPLAATAKGAEERFNKLYFKYVVP